MALLDNEPSAMFRTLDKDVSLNSKEPRVIGWVEIGTEELLGRFAKIRCHLHTVTNGTDVSSGHMLLRS